MYQHIISRKRPRCGSPDIPECVKRIMVQSYTQSKYHVAFKSWLQDSNHSQAAFCYGNVNFMIRAYGPHQIRITMEHYDFVAMGIIVLNAAWNNMTCVFTKHNINAEQMQELVQHGFSVHENPVAYLIHGPDIKTPNIIELAKCVIKRTPVNTI